MNKEFENPENEVDDEQADENRRDALRKLGHLTYSAPIMVSLLASKNASGQVPSNPPPPP